MYQENKTQTVCCDNTRIVDLWFTNFSTGFGESTIPHFIQSDYNYSKYLVLCFQISLQREQPLFLKLMWMFVSEFDFKLIWKVNALNFEH